MAIPLNIGALKGMHFRRAVLLVCLFRSSLPVWGDSSLQKALAGLKSTKVVQRREAAQQLGVLQDKHAAPALLEALADQDSYVRVLAVRALGYMRRTEAIAALTQLLKTDPEAEVRESVVQALQLMGGPASLSALAEATHDKVETIRASALDALVVFRSSATLATLSEAARDPSPMVRRMAVVSLGRYGDPVAGPVLTAALKDSDAATRANAAQMLGQIGGLQARPALRVALKDSEKAVQASAARSLAMLHDREGFETAMKLAKDPNRSIQLMSIDALGFMHDPVVIPFLESLTHGADPYVRDAAASAIQQIKSSQGKQKPKK